MPSTFSTNLRLELMATGENENTWGQKANDSVFRLLESAICDVVPVAMSDANYTLTTQNGSADEARGAVIQLTGSLSATRNVVCPTADKLYLVSNGTTGGQSIVFKTTAGTGITIPNGKKRWVYCDGTNVVDAITDLPSGTTLGGSTITDSIGAVTLTGTQTITGPKTFTNQPLISSANPSLRISDTDAGLDAKEYIIGGNTNNFGITFSNDALNSFVNPLLIARTGTTIGAATWLVTQHLGVAGTVGAPAYSFSGDPNTGIYSFAADRIGLAAGGVNVAIFDGNGIYVRDGTASLPGLSFINASNCGFYRIGANNIGAAANGTLIWQWDTAGLKNATGNLFLHAGNLGSTVQAWDADLDAVAVLGGTGLAVRTGPGAWAQRAIDQGVGIVITNGSGVAANPNVAVDIATATQFRNNTADKILATDDVWSAAVAVTLTDASTIAVDMSTFINAQVTLAGNRVLGQPTSTKVGQSGFIRINQDAGGNRQLTFHADWKFAGGADPTVSTVANTTDVLFYQVMATNFIYATLVKGLA